MFKQANKRICKCTDLPSFLRSLHSSLFTFLLAFLVTSTSVFAQQASDSVAPEFSSSPSPQKTLVPKFSTKTALASEFIAVTAHPLATQAAFDVLNADGSAIDAMVSVQTILGLVEPQSSGLGGGSFVLYFDAIKKQLTTFDGRETAPIKSSPDLFMADNTTAMAFFDAVVGGRSVGTPGTVKLLWELHKKYGKKDWSDLLTPAIDLANGGFTVTERMAASILRDKNRLNQDPEAAAYFYPNKRPLKEGALLKNPAYAETLITLSKKGGDYFYHKDFSQPIIEKVQRSENKGYLSQEDFNQYQIIERPASCIDYRIYQVCGMGPPSSGALSVNQILGVLENFNMSEYKSTSPLSWQLISEASRLAFADRAQYIADPAFFHVPLGLLDKDYLKERSKMIKIGLSNPEITHGIPPGWQQSKLIQGNSPEQNSTTHFVIVDKIGNIVSMTSTIENAFGSRLMVKGFLLNNELTDFSFLPKKNGELIANRVEPGKRPRSSMAPTIVFRNDETGENTPYLALGSPGGSRIINYVANSLIRVLDWNEDLQHSFDSPHIINRFGKMELEQNTNAVEFTEDFTKMNYSTSEQDINSGLHGVIFQENGLFGAADRRREGTAQGR